MYSTEFSTVYAAERIASARRAAWADSLRPSPRERLLRGLARFAVRLQPDLESTTTLPRRAC